MKALRKLIDGIGRTRICERLHVSSSAVSNHLADKNLPAGWYLGMKNLADDAGLDCPLELFKWTGDVSFPPKESRPDEPVGGA